MFAKAREKARQTSCLSNEKQIGLGILQYVQDYDEMFPGRFMNVEAQSWRVITQPYIKSSQIYACPSNGHKSNLALDGTMPISYAVNGEDDSTRICPNGGQTPMPANGGRTLAQMNAPAGLILVTETLQPWGESPGGFDSSVPWASLAPIHTGRANFLMGDGHAKSLKPTNTVDRANNTNPANMWAMDQSPPTTTGSNIVGWLQAVETNFQ